MRRFVSSLVVGALALTFTTYAWSGGDDARVFIEKAIQASGGEANLAKLKSMTWKEKGTYYGMGDGLPYTGVLAIQYPDKFRMEIENVFLLVINGDKGWQKAKGETKAMDKEQIAEQQTNQRAGWVASLIAIKDKAYTVKMLPATKDQNVVEVTRADYPTVKLYFDKKTNLLVKSEFKTKASDLKFKEVTMEMSYSDYRDVDGAKVAHHVVLKRDGKLFVEADMLDLKAGAKINPKTFEMP